MVAPFAARPAPRGPRRRTRARSTQPPRRRARRAAAATPAARCAAACAAPTGPRSATDGSSPRARPAPTRPARASYAVLAPPTAPPPAPCADAPGAARPAHGCSPLHRGTRVGYARTAPPSTSPSPSPVASATTERRAWQVRGWGHFWPSLRPLLGPDQAVIPTRKQQNRLQPGGCGPGSSARRHLVRVRGDCDPRQSCGDEGHAEGLRRRRGEAAGEKLGTTPADRHTVNVGSVRRPPFPPCGLHGGGQARCRLLAAGRGGAPVVVRGQKSCPHGQGGQQARRVGTGTPGGRR